jgi:hypothetical protein
MKYRIILFLITIGILIPGIALSDEGQVSVTVNPGFTLLTKNSTYNFNNGPKIDVGIGYDTSDESNVSFILGYNRFTNALDNKLSMNLAYAGIALKQYLNSGISKGYLTGGLNFDYANFSGTPAQASGIIKPSDDAGLGFNVGLGVDVMASSTFFFGPVIKYEGIILQKTYVSLITLQLTLGLLF